MLKTFENYINDYKFEKAGSVKDAILYSLLNAGKRIRPNLLLSLLSDYGIDYKVGFSSALAVEMIHNYSLIHDDLPAMDDDDYRRNKLSTHKAFGEDIAILAGDALLTEAFKVISNDDNLAYQKRCLIISKLADFSGINGMIYGQQQDLLSEGEAINLNQVDEINIYKTAKLINFSLAAASIIADKTDDLVLINDLATNLGLAFQIQDDIFDVSKDFDEIGKLPSDEKNAKATYVKLLGLEESEAKLAELFANCFEILEKLDLKSNNLYNLISEIKQRTY